MNRVVWTELVLANHEAIQLYIAQFNPTAANAVATNPIFAGNDLAIFPNRGRPVPRTALREWVTEYPYILRYRIDGDTVVILRVRQASRRQTDP